MMKTQRNSCQHHPDYTLPETNIASENRWLEHAFPFGAFRPIFRDKMAKRLFQGGGFICTPIFSKHPHGSGERSRQSRHLFDANLHTAMVCWRVGLLTRMIVSFPAAHCSLLQSWFWSGEIGVPIKHLFYRVFGALGIYIQLSNGDILP